MAFWDAPSFNLDMNSDCIFIVCELCFVSLINVTDFLHKCDKQTLFDKMRTIS